MTKGSPILSRREQIALHLGVMCMAFVAMKPKVIKLSIAGIFRAIFS
jgi:hypothetical protein